MRILLYPRALEVGGSQLNAIELGGCAVRAGHEVLLFGPDDVLVPYAQELGLEFHPAPVRDSWPSVRNTNRLVQLVRDRDIQVVHAYEWGPALDLAYGPHLRLGTPMLVTVLDMVIQPFTPRHVPLVVGTRELAESARSRHAEVHLLEPPIDTLRNAPGPDPRVARKEFGVDDGEFVVSLIGRLTASFDKAGGVLEAIAATDQLAERLPIRLLVAGDGPERDRVEGAAAAVNRRTGRQTVLVTGDLLDPRPVYDAADVVLGMGSSALKGLAFAKPLVVQGPSGHWRLLTPESASTFLWQGWMGQDPGNGATALREVLETLLPDDDARAQLGQFGRQLVTEHYSLEQAAVRMDHLYRQVQARTWSPVRRAWGLGHNVVDMGISGRLWTPIRRVRRRISRGRSGSGGSA